MTRPLLPELPATARLGVVTAGHSPLSLGRSAIDPQQMPMRVGPGKNPQLGREPSHAIHI
jgi:hypothetical protein